MTIPDEYKVDHLFLLIGENPLPNYVAAKLLIEKGGTVYLVHTNGTDRQATQLQRILDSELEKCQPCQRISLENHESDAYRIQRKIREWIEKSDNGSIGMNYTGGTKAMAVHAYRAAFQAGQEKDQRIKFSYLDSRKLAMCFDRQEGESEKFPISSQDLSIKLETIFELHDRKCKKPPSKTPIMPDLATVLAKINVDEAKTRGWFDWFYSIFCEGNDEPSRAARKPKRAGGKPGNWKSKTDLAQLSFPLICLPQEVIDGLCAKGFVDSNNELALGLVKESGECKNLQEFCEWLDGKWLEHYLLQQISSITNQVNIFDYGMNFDVPLAGTKDGFEFDVAFTYGYQLFAISCTTSADRGLCKSKLFEAYLRSQQLGGSEARVALICFNNDLGGLTSEMADILSEKQVRLFGRKHLTNLANEIIDWIKDSDAEIAK